MINDELEKLGLKDIKEIYHNISYDELFNHEIKNQEGRVSANGTFMVDTGIFTGRSPKDKYFVRQDPSQKFIAWGNINRPISKELFDKCLKLAKDRLSGKNLYVPYIDTDSKQMCLCKINNLADDLERGHYGILEPKKNLRKPVNSDIIDCVISPGVAFTTKKDRTGYGGGYYDRFYSSLKQRPFIVALAYDFQILESLPTESFDVPVDMIITEKKIIK